MKLNKNKGWAGSFQPTLRNWSSWDLWNSMVLEHVAGGENGPAAQDLPLWCQWGTWCQPECNSGRQEPGWRGRKALAQVRGVKETGNARGNRWSGRKGTDRGKWLTSTDAEQEWGDPRRVEVNLPETRGVFLMWRGGIPGPKGNGSQSIFPTNLVLGMAGRQTGGQETTLPLNLAFTKVGRWLHRQFSLL